jgi:hypothetical protein
MDDNYLIKSELFGEAQELYRKLSILEKNITNRVGYIVKAIYKTFNLELAC